MTGVLTMARHRVCLLSAAWLAAAVMAASPVATAQDKSPANLAAVLGELRQGGLVIYMRHAATEHTAHEAEDPARCEAQRNLSAAGRAEAVRIGKALKALAIPIGAVSVSPYCRAKDTARLAFGRFTVATNLGFVMGANAGETKRMAEALRLRLATPPEPGSNSVIVSHSANLYEAAGIFAKPEGAVYVFRPKADGRFEAVARILPEEWSEAARLAPPPIKTASGR